MKSISFPGIGIEAFTVNPVAFTLPIFGGLQVRWYGILITLGIVLAFIYTAYRAKQEGIIFDDLLDIAIFTIIFGVIGARAFYVLTSLDKYQSLYSVIAIWEGGLAIYGGLIAGALTIRCVCWIKKISFQKMLDAVAPAVMIAQAIGRWGNFFNGEAHGVEVAEGSLLYFIRMGLLPSELSAFEMHFFHPTFLYESLWNIVGFIILHSFYKKKKFDGQIVLMYITWYGFGRMFIEGLRTDSLYIFRVIRISQAIGFVCFVVGSILLVVFLLRARRLRLNGTPYIPTYEKISHMSAKANTPENTAEDELDGDAELDSDDSSPNDPTE